MSESSSLEVGFVRPGTDWVMELFRQTINAFKTRLDHHLRNVKGHS